MNDSYFWNSGDPSIANLVELVGGEDVEVTSFINGEDNPRAFKPTNEHVKVLNNTDLFVLNGHDLENIWLEDFLKKVSKEDVKQGKPGFLNPSIAIKPILISKGTFRRLSGRGMLTVNPNYLLDPANGIITAQSIAVRLKAMMPEKVSEINERLAKFQMAIFRKLVGEKLAANYDGRKLSKIIKLNRFEKELSSLQDHPDVGGWFKQLNSSNSGFVVDHDSFIYLLTRFGMKKTGVLEIRPGFPPMPSYIQRLRNSITPENTSGILTNIWFKDPAAKNIADKTGIPLKLMAHQVGTFKECKDYHSFLDFNIQKLAECLAGKTGK